MVVTFFFKSNLLFLKTVLKSRRKKIAVVRKHSLTGTRFTDAENINDDEDVSVPDFKV